MTTIQDQIETRIDELEAERDSLLQLRRLLVESGFAGVSVNGTEPEFVEIEVEALPKPGRHAGKVLARELVCPTCKADSGEQCRQMTRRGAGGKPILGTSIGKKTHTKRRAAARQANA